MSESTMQIIGLFLANAGLIVWFRAEARSDWRHMDAQMQAIRDDIKDFHTRLAVQDKEFKNRLCAIEENRGKK